MKELTFYKCVEKRDFHIYLCNKNKVHFLIVVDYSFLTSYL